MLTVPAHPFLFDEMDEIAHHRRRYTRDALGAKLRAAGFAPRRLAHFMAPLVPLVATALGGARARARSQPARAPQAELRVVPGLNGAMRALLRLERPLARAGLLPFGTSLVAVAERPRDGRAAGVAHDRAAARRRGHGAAIQEELRPSFWPCAAAECGPAWACCWSATTRPPRSTCGARRAPARSSACYHETARLPGDARARRGAARWSRSYNRRPEIHGILVQLPLPPQVETRSACSRRRPGQGRGRLPSRERRAAWCRSGRASWPAPRRASWSCCARSGIELAGRACGGAWAAATSSASRWRCCCMHADATVTVCHSRTRDLAAVTREADVLVAAIGRPGLVRAEHVKPGAVVVDVGINRVSDPALARELVEPERLAEFDEGATRWSGTCTPRRCRARRGRAHAGARRRRAAHHRDADGEHGAGRRGRELRPPCCGSA